MNNIEQAQNIFLQWMQCYEVRSYEQIKIACRNICKSYSLEIEYPHYKILNPLLETGLIEFAGNGKFYYTKPTVLKSKRRDSYLGFNLSEEQKNEIGEYECNALGIIKFETAKKNIMDLCYINNFSYSEFDLNEILGAIPTLENIIDNLDKVYINSKLEYWNQSTFKWQIKQVDNKEQLCRKEGVVHKTYLQRNHCFYDIPTYTQNPETRSIVESYLLSKYSNQKPIYYKKEKTIKILAKQLPMLLKRILQTHSLFYNIKIPLEDDFILTIPNLNTKTIKNLSRILAFNVEVIDE